MSEPSPLQVPNKKERGLLERLSSLLLREPEDREQLLEVLQQAHERNLLDADALSMIEGVMQVSDLSAGDIMVPRAQMDAINAEDSIDQIVAFAVEKAHSRFPVYEGERDNVIGVLLAKDLLRIHADSDVNLRDMLRPAVFIPESKRLNVLLHDFRLNRNHIALVVDEYGGVAGLVTIEDVLEQIVGDIEDEYDSDEEADNIVSLGGDQLGLYRVKALTTIEQFNETFGTGFSNEHADTLGGLLTDHLARCPCVVMSLSYRLSVLKCCVQMPGKCTYFVFRKLNLRPKTLIPIHPPRTQTPIGPLDVFLSGRRALGGTLGAVVRPDFPVVAWAAFACRVAFCSPQNQPPLAGRPGIWVVSIWLGRFLVAHQSAHLRRFTLYAGLGGHCRLYALFGTFSCLGFVVLQSFCGGTRPVLAGHGVQCAAVGCFMDFFRVGSGHIHDRFCLAGAGRRAGRFPVYRPVTLVG